jgi:hypothetical protein
MKVRCKSREILKECIGLHGLMEERDIPSCCKNNVPKDELWIRDDHCQHNTIEDENINLHEDVELLLIEDYGLTYQIAHNIATIAEEKWKRFRHRIALQSNSHY